MRRHRRVMSISAAAILSLSGPACARQNGNTEAAEAEQPAGAEDAGSPAPKEDYVIGPSGRRLLKFEEPPEGATIDFTQIAVSLTGVSVLGSDANFDITRLPATFKATVGNEVCTATLIGPQVLLTAAHCVDARKKKTDGTWDTLRGRLTLSNGASGPAIRFCTMAPAYTDDEPRKDSVRNENDFALCELALPVNIRAETISLQPGRIAAKEPLLVAGYGCTEKDLKGDRIGQTNRTSGKLHVAANRVRGGGPDGFVDFTGTIGSNDAIACPGDSGGAAYAGASIPETGNDYGWRIVAVTSSVGPAGPPKQYDSYFAPLSDPQFAILLELWTGTRSDNREICGYTNVSLGPTRCRP